MAHLKAQYKYFSYYVIIIQIMCRTEHLLDLLDLVNLRKENAH